MSFLFFEKNRLVIQIHLQMEDLKLVRDSGKGPGVGIFVYNEGVTS